MTVEQLNVQAVLDFAQRLGHRAFGHEQLPGSLGKVAALRDDFKHQQLFESQLHRLVL